MNEFKTFIQVLLVIAILVQTLLGLDAMRRVENTAPYGTLFNAAAGPFTLITILAALLYLVTI